MNIGLDIDGVIYPWHYSVYKYYCEFRNFEGTEIEFWRYFRTLNKETQNFVVSIPFLYSDTTPYESTLEALSLLSSLGTLYYLTSRPVEVKLQTEKFFNKYKLPFKENVIFTKEKETYIRLYNIKYFVDDLPDNINKIGNLSKCFLYRSAHNVDQREEFNCVTNLMEFYNKIKQEQIIKELGYAS